MIVVAAGILTREGRFLITQRMPGKRLALKWEFPGGKLEPGETPEQALERELMEELAIETRTGDIFAAEVSGENPDILVLFYQTALVRGEPQAIDCNALAWVFPEDFSGYDLAGADARIAERLFRAANA